MTVLGRSIATSISLGAWFHAGRFVLAECAGLTQVSDQGGIVARVLPPSTASAEPARTAEKTEPAFTDRARDQFFSLAWRAEEALHDIRITGLLENRDGPEVMDVTLRIILWTAEETPLTERLVTLDGIVQKKDVRSFGERET